MKKKKIVPVYVVQFWKIKLTFRALVIIAVTTILIILSIKFGYDKEKGGCYSTPGNIDINIKKNIM